MILEYKTNTSMLIKDSITKPYEDVRDFYTWKEKLVQTVLSPFFFLSFVQLFLHIKLQILLIRDYDNSTTVYL